MISSTELVIPASPHRFAFSSSLTTPEPTRFLSSDVYKRQVLPYDKGGLLQQIRETVELIAEEYLPEGIRIEAYVPPELFEKIHA